MITYPADEAVTRIRLVADAIEQTVARHPDCVITRNALGNPIVLDPDGTMLGWADVFTGEIDLNTGGPRRD